MIFIIKSIMIDSSATSDTSVLPKTDSVKKSNPIFLILGGIILLTIGFVIGYILSPKLKPADDINPEVTTTVTPTTTQTITTTDTTTTKPTESTGSTSTPAPTAISESFSSEKYNIKFNYPSRIAGQVSSSIATNHLNEETVTFFYSNLVITYPFFEGGDGGDIIDTTKAQTKDGKQCTIKTFQTGYGFDEFNITALCDHSASDSTIVRLFVDRLHEQSDLTEWKSIVKGIIESMEFDFTGVKYPM